MAAKHFEAGEVKASLYLCDRVLEAKSDNAAALHLKGLGLHKLGAVDDAYACLEASLRHAPHNQLFAANTVEVYRSSGLPTKAEAVGDRAVQAPPVSAVLVANLALAKYDLGKIDDAKRLHESALATAPNHLASLNNLGTIARDEGDLEKAVGYYDHVLTLRPRHFEARNNLITVLLEKDDFVRAQDELNALLAVAPDNPEANRSQARLHLMQNELDQAELRFRTVLKGDPAHVLAMVGLSQVMTEKNRHDLALRVAEDAYRLNANEKLVAQQVGATLTNLGEVEKAAEFFDAALALDQAFGPALLAKGHAAMEAGELKTAEDWFAQALAKGQDDLSPRIALTSLKKPKSPDDPHFAALRALEKDAPAFSAQKAASYYFALGDCYDAVGDYEAAFQAYDIGAQKKRTLISYDADQHEEVTRDIIETFDPDFVQHLRRSANSSAKPIFVLGMPRSGTTLTETILASHSQVFGAGELNDLQTLFDVNARDRTPFPKNLQALTPRDFQTLISKYVNRLDELGSEAPRVTDKMPANFKMLGIIHALMPNAKIVHVARNPMDTCLSCYTRLFERSQLNSYDLVELGRYYVDYRRLMVHWSSTLPGDAFLTVQYEDLVHDFEANTRRLLDYVGLAFEPACLEFYKSKRRVKTASITQVRQPLYSSSLEKWRRYENQLQPLKRTLELGGVL
ncbi:sulfotransferase [Cognatiyoonia sp. IB215182]|nr:sulfotransferase [Cognatiyoonia sp. IB215182]